MAAVTQHIGVSDLRKYKAEKLADLNAQRKVCVIHEHAQPIAALVSFDLYMEWQRLLVSAESGGR